MAILKTKAGIGSLLLTGMAVSALFLAGCRVAIPAPGTLTVVDATRSPDDAASGFLTTVDCSPLVGQQHATEVSAVSYASIPLVNAGGAEVAITGVELMLTDSSGTPLTHEQTYFTWGAGHAPDVPFTLEAGKKFVFNVAFSSSTAGVFYGCMNVTTSDGSSQQVRLTGEAGWPVTLQVSNALGQITAPVTVTNAQAVVYLCASSTLTLTAATTDPVGLTELQAWTVVAGGATIASAATLTATATITGPATIRADFADVYVHALPPDLVAARSTLVGDPSKIGIALAAGVYTLSGDIELPSCIVRGGYATDFLTRPAYQSQADRASAAGTRIETNGFDLRFNGSSITSGALLEGVQVTVTNVPTPPPSPPTPPPVIYAGLVVENGAAPTLRSCTFIGAGGAVSNSVGLYIYASSPTVDTCVILGSDTTATGGRSVGLWTTYSGAPMVTGCTISAGAASGTDGKTYGVLNSSFASSPIIQNCTIDGGAGTAFSAAFWTGEGGRPRLEGNTLFTRNAASSNHGVYIYSNGRMETLFGNNIYGCNTAIVFDYPHDQRAYTSIDDVNDDFVSGDQEANTSAEP